MGGAVANLDKKLNQTVLLLECVLHFNELPCKAVFKSLNEGTTGPKPFTRAIRTARQNKDLHLSQIVNFTPIHSRLNTPGEEILKDVFTDQDLLYHYGKEVSSGALDPRHVFLKPARWLT